MCACENRVPLFSDRMTLIRTELLSDVKVTCQHHGSYAEKNSQMNKVQVSRDVV